MKWGGKLIPQCAIRIWTAATLVWITLCKLCIHLNQNLTEGSILNHVFEHECDLEVQSAFQTQIYNEVTGVLKNREA